MAHMSHVLSTEQGSRNASEPEVFLRLMVRWPDDRLLQVVTHDRALFSQYALNVAEAELRLRGVSFTVPVTPANAAKASSRKITKKHKEQLVGLAFWLVYLLYIWSRDTGGLPTPLAWLVHGLFGAMLSFAIVMTLFEGAEYLLRKLRRSS
jgi:hypothetical protein